MPFSIFATIEIVEVATSVESVVTYPFQIVSSKLFGENKWSRLKINVGNKCAFDLFFNYFYIYYPSAFFFIYFALFFFIYLVILSQGLLYLNKLRYKVLLISSPSFSLVVYSVKLYFFFK